MLRRSSTPLSTRILLITTNLLSTRQWLPPPGPLQLMPWCLALNLTTPEYCLREQYWPLSRRLDRHQARIAQLRGTPQPPTGQQDATMYVFFL
jgi:hypothetical protein